MRISIWNIEIDILTVSEIINSVSANLEHERIPFQITGVNPDTIIQAQNNKDLRNAILASNIVNIDGMSVVNSLRIMRYSIKERAACPEIFESLIDLAHSKQYRIFFLGSTDEILKKMIINLQNKYHNLKIIGYHNGYYDEENEIDLAHTIKRAEVDILFLGLPTPKKELFINRYIEYMNVPVCLGVGGMFDIKAGKYKRAPKIFQRIGLEWLYRFAQEPKRLFKREIITNSKFVFLVIKTFITK